ncbi:MAG: HD domain-containing protein, partial [Candidatus Dormibacteraceae bacterium]
VYGHTLLAVERIEPELRLRLAALFHDVGKPRVAAPDGTFYGHAEVGAEITEAALARLRFPNQINSEVSQLVRLHMRPIAYSRQWSDGAVRRLARTAGELLPALLALARADTAASAYPRPEEMHDLEHRLEAVLAEQPSRLRIPINGQDIMRQRGLSPSPEVGRIKARLIDLVLEGELEPERETLLAYLEQNPDL